MFNHQETKTPRKAKAKSFDFKMFLQLAFEAVLGALGALVVKI